MKIINYNYGYIPLFDCVIKGKIQMDYDEYRQVKKYLFNPSVKSNYLYKDILKEDFERQLSVKRNKFWVNIRTTATEKIVDKFGLDKYKRANYVIEVKPA